MMEWKTEWKSWYNDEHTSIKYETEKKGDDDDGMVDEMLRMRCEIRGKWLRWEFITIESWF